MTARRVELVVIRDLGLTHDNGTEDGRCERLEEYIDLAWGKGYSLGLVVDAANVSEVVDSTGELVGYIFDVEVVE